MQTTPAEFYTFLGELLAIESPERFPHGSITNRASFIAALKNHNPHQREYFFIDEAAALALLPTLILNSWLDVVRELKNHRFKHNVGGIILFGTWAVNQLLEECNRCARCQVQIYQDHGMTKP